uniref:Uncharacterized protein n=1 Tax=Rhizophora mucronata TaxID=61149 RepID=A0A2P2JQ22_RHIMU
MGNGTYPSQGMPDAGADVPGLVLATSCGTSLYFMTQKNIKLDYRREFITYSSSLNTKG